MEIDHHHPIQEPADEPQEQTDEGQHRNSTSSSAPATLETAVECFDCNICLDFAQDPVVTFCGHLYCWSCIYRWINHKESSPQYCPVCKAALSQATMVPLYGRGDVPCRANHPHVFNGLSTTTHLDIPQRPAAYRMNDLLQSPHQRRHSQMLLEDQHEPYHYNRHPMALATSIRGGGSGLGSSRLFQSSSGGFGGTAIAVLPWIFGCPEAGLYYSNPYYLSGGGHCPLLRRQEIKAERSLSRISAFLICCVILCLLLF